MMGVVWSLLGILSGAFIAIQAPINSQLARGLGLPVAAAAFSFLSGAIVLGIVSVTVVKLQGISLDWKAPAPWLFVAGGMLGGFYVTLSDHPDAAHRCCRADGVPGRRPAAGRHAHRPRRLPRRGGARDLARPRCRRGAAAWPERCSSGSTDACRPLRFRPAGRAHRAAPGRAARQRAAAGRRARRSACTTGSVRDLPSLLEPGDVLVFNDTKVIPAQLKGIRRRGEATAQVEATLHMRVAPDRWQAFVRPGKRIAAGDRIQFGHDGNACLLGQLDATVIEKGEGGEVLLRFDLSGAGPRRGAARRRPHPAAALHRRQARRRRARPRRLPDDLRPRRGRGRSADGRPAFHAGAVRGARREGRRAAFRDAACRRRHLPAGQGRRHRRPQDACRDRPCQRETADSAERRQGAGRAHRRVGTTSLRLLESAARDGRHDLQPGPGRPTSSSRPATASGPSTC